MTTQELPSSSSTPKWNYDVFLSFRGEDTRKNFTDHLYAALHQRGIRTFRDDDKLERGKEISGELLKAIEESRISLIVLSSNYASSTWCLDELVKVLECKQTKGLTVMPIFYNVDPSEVRKQTGSFAQAFAKYEEGFKEKMEIVRRWKAALTEVANLSGWDLRSIADGHHAKFIQKIIQDIWNKLNQNYAFLYVAEHQVGMDSRVEEINLLLGVGGFDDVRIIGIWGIGGIGKTTLAKAIYNQIAEQFEGSTFLANVREDSRRHDGLIHLQRKLLCEILKEENLNLGNVDRGVVVIQERLRYRRVLVILDDVDHLDQLKKLAGNPNWFGLGSRIIITTRDKHLLTTYEVCETYMVKELNDDEALQLFSSHAFKDHPPTSDFLELSNHVVDYAGGLPLALEVLGSFLCTRSIFEWKSALEKLKNNPNKEIHETLKISFDGLESHEKDIFLDLACFFIGENKSYVEKVLESCGFYPDVGLGILIRRSLVTISDNMLWMHDLLQEMGREIVRQESPNEPGKRSRLWFDKDVYRVLRRNTGTNAVQAIVLNFSTVPDEVHFSNDAFTRMTNLRLLQICNNYLVGPAEYYFPEGGNLSAEYFVNGVPEYGNMNVFEGINYLPDELRYLNWHGYPSKSLPSNFHPWKLVEIDMRCSRLEQLWKTKINLENLESLNLSDSQYLIETPDFSGFPRLKILILKGCTRLVKVHPSNLVLDMLVFLNLKDCKSLQSLWKSIKLESLQTLILSGCSKLEKFPEILRTMEHLSEAYLDGTGIKELPSSIEHLTGLVLLNLESCKNLTSLPSNIGTLKSLELLTLSGCSKLERFSQIPKDMEHLSKVYLNGAGIKELPSSIEHLTGLVSLNLENCKNLTSLPSNIGMLKSLELLTLSGCSKLERFPEISEDMEHLVKLLLDGTAIKELPSSITHLKRLVMLNLGNCKNLASLPSGICELNSLANLTLSGCSKLDKLPENLGNLQNLVSLHLDGTAIRQPPSSVLHLKSLQTLSFRGCRGSSSHSWKSIFLPLLSPKKVPCSSGLMLPCLSGLCSLTTLDLSDCNLSEEGIISAIVGLSSLKDLNLSKNNFVSLPATFNQFNSLKNLRLEHCTRLQALPPLPKSIYEIDAHGCRSLEKLSYPPQNHECPYRSFTFGNCKILAGHKGSTFFQRNRQVLSGAFALNLIVPGSEIPEWMNEESMGSSICFKMSPLEYSKFKGVIFCAVFTLKGAADSEDFLKCKLSHVIDGVSSCCFYPWISILGNRYLESDHVWLRCQSRDQSRDLFKGNTSSSDGWHHFEASFGAFKKLAPLQVKKCGVHIIYEEDDEPTMIPSNSSFHNLTLEEVEEEEDIVISKHKRRLAEEEASGSGCSNKRMRGNTHTVLKLEDKEST